MGFLGGLILVKGLLRGLASNPRDFLRGSVSNSSPFDHPRYFESGVSPWGRRQSKTYFQYFNDRESVCIPSVPFYISD